LGLGNNLLQALATGTAWFSNKAKLQHLSQLTRVRSLQQKLDGYIKLWENDSVSISIDSSWFGFHARVAQYEFQSIDALKEKLIQFPSGTTFAISISTVESPANQDQTELQTFLRSHGMSVRE